MKFKGSGILVAVIALIGAILLLLPTVILPTLASDTVVTYANNTFESLTSGAEITNDSVNFFTKTPSTAKAVIYKRPINKAIEVQLAPAATTADAIATEIKSGGDNIDKNITVANSEMSYANADRVYLSVDYYIPSGAKGTVQSQFLGWSDNGTNKTWLSLYYINMATGTLRPRDETVLFPVLDFDAWNTVTVVVDLDSAQMDYYVNGVFVTSVENSGSSNLVLKENQWIIAKINKNSSGLASDYAGYFRVDNAMAYTALDSYVQTIEANDADGNPLTGMKIEKLDGSVTEMKLVNSAAKIFLPSIVSAEPVYFDLSDYQNVIAPVPGASIRLNSSSGLRFATQLDTDLLAKLIEAKEDGTIANVEIGTLITPKNYADAAGAIGFIELDEKLNASTKYINVKATIGDYYGVPDGVTMDEGYDTCFVGSIVNIKVGNRSRPFSAVGYVKVTTHAGKSSYIYSYAYDVDGIANYSRSIKGVAQSALADTTREWTERELSVLNGFVEGITTLELDSSILSSVQKTAYELYFRNAAGIYCRLTYDGYNGWRLQANASSYDGFDDTGAAQALGLYLGEDPKDTAERLTIVDDGGVLKVTAANHDTYVTIDYTDSFQMRFYSATGALMSNVSDVSFTGATSSEASDEFFTIKGNLLDGEAVYGGGERFDVVNKRGTSFVLYTSDGWNSTATTYVAVPLFVTSRGAGIFMNRYERIVADFGAASSDEWVLTLDNDLMDCYFYATGAMSDALLGYTELSGHSGLPEEWAQGEMICRYSPDLATFEDRSEYRTNYTSYTQIPNYTSYYVQGTNGSSTIRSAIGSEYSNYTYDYTILYESPATSSPNVIYYLNEETGTYDKTGAKGNPAGDGVKTIVTNLINAGMKPHSMLMEPWGWSSVSSNAEKAADLKETVEWLENLGIKTMLYMGVASISSNMSGYKSEYQVWANLTYEDGTIDRIYKLPRTSGNGTNPDVGTSSTQQFLDITNPEAVDWYMNFIWDQLIDIGIDGIKIDFCETMPNEGWLYDQSTGQNFYFEYDWYDDSVFEDDDVHHAYSTYFISLFYNNMNKMKAEKGIPDGFVVLSRGGGIGSQRNPYLWEGDQVRSFEKIEDQLIALINTGISGIPFMTYDMAGYAYSSRSGSFTMSVETESAIFARAIEYTAFTSNIQTHGDVRHAYQMTEETQEIYREFCDLHEELLPYIQKYSKVACDTGMPVVRHMVLQYQDDANVYDLETQYMFGDAILVAPIVSANQTSKDVYLPAGSWLNLLTGETVAGGQTVTVSADLGQIPVFMNTDCSAEDRALLATVFNGETWQAISGVTLNIETVAD